MIKKLAVLELIIAFGLIGFDFASPTETVLKIVFTFLGLATFSLATLASAIYLIDY